MTAMLTVLFAVLFFACILVSIALHEIGHMVPAKAFGIRVPKYFVGFGPTIWSTVRGETEYGVKVIPAGAYVKIPGMVNIDEVPPEEPGAAEDEELHRASPCAAPVSRAACITTACLPLPG